MKYTNDEVHEGYINLSNKKIGRIRHSIWQLPFKNIEEVISKANRYSSLGVKKLQAKNVEIVIFEPTIQEANFERISVIKDFEEFSLKSDVIVANRFESKLENVKDKIYTRDIFNSDK